MLNRMFTEAACVIKEVKTPGAVPVMCDKTSCTFEFVLYKFIRKYPPRPAPLRPPLKPGELPPGLTKVNGTPPPQHSNIQRPPEAASTSQTSDGNGT